MDTAAAPSQVAPQVAVVRAICQGIRTSEAIALHYGMDLNTVRTAVTRARGKGYIAVEKYVGVKGRKAGKVAFYKPIVTSCLLADIWND